LGDTPSPDEALRVLRRAGECFDLKSFEISWNFEVHAPLLSLGLRPDPDVISHGCDFVAWIIREYLHGYVPEKLVDFCLFLNPSVIGDSAAARRIDQIRTHLPEQMINHTVYESLGGRPIALSIETKKAEAGLINANLQIGVWHTAQWNFLRSVAGDTLDNRRLAFLPAIIVEGNDWSFAATTRKGTITTLWSKQPIGSTTDPLGIYKIVAALRYLQRWARREYWPWFREVVLGFPA
ncbi:hypothetical protein M406DRAFT_250030, partial [Cryphonectria parasitica EP155]